MNKSLKEESTDPYRLSARASWDQVLTKLNVALLTSAHRRKSGVIVCHCIFHSEKTESLHFWPLSGRYRCHGCGQEGDKMGLVLMWYFNHNGTKHPLRENEESFLRDFFKHLPIVTDIRQREFDFA